MITEAMDNTKVETSKINKTRLATFFHTSLLIHHVYVCNYTQENIDFNSTNTDVLDLETYRFRYLTTWNMCLQSFYLLLAIYTDVIRLTGSHKENNLFRRIEATKTYIFTSLVFPTGLFVSVFFWFVFNLDRELVYPQHLDSIVPSWVNHSIHTAIIALPLVEIVYQKRAPSFRAALKGMTIFSILYDITYFLTYYQSSRWLYKVFNVLSWPERCTLVVFLYLLSALILWIGVTIQKCIINKKYRKITPPKNILKKLL